MLKKPHLSCWHKIDTFHKISHTLVDWYLLKLDTTKAPSRKLRLAPRIVDQKLPTGKIITTRESWPSPYLPRYCGNPAEDVPHILQGQKGDETWEKL